MKVNFLSGVYSNVLCVGVRRGQRNGRRQGFRASPNMCRRSPEVQRLNKPDKGSA